ncbi:MAG: hypothetical protein ACLQDF_00215 [Desulfomonilia bacterium]
MTRLSMFQHLWPSQQPVLYALHYFPDDGIEQGHEKNSKDRARDYTTEYGYTDWIALRAPKLAAVAMMKG